MSDLLLDLNPAQRDAAFTTEGPLLVLAGAGSGKTRVLTYRIAHLVRDRGVSPAEILAITFTNKAANEMRERLEGLCGPCVRSMWVMTFHAMCVRILRADAHRIGYGRHFTIYDEDDARRTLAAVLADLDVDQKRFPPKLIAHRISAAKNELISPEACASQAVSPPDKVASKAYAPYQERLRAACAMDFDDLLFKTWELLRTCPDVLEHYQRRFRYIHVDEYQDTNHAQYEIVNMLASGHGNLMVVGDDDQSIYSWRGADIRNILEFERDHPDATVIRLEQNYRSTVTILAAANAIVANNRGRRPKTLWTENVGGEAITRYVALDERDEARFVAREIERLVEDDGRTYADVAVFYRTNAQSRVLEDAFLRVGIPYQLIGGTRFFERMEVKDVLAWLHVIVNPADVQSFIRVMERRPGIGKTTVGLLQARAFEEGVPIEEALRLAVREEWTTQAVLRRLAELATDLDAARTAVREAGTLRLAVERVVARAGLLSQLEAEGTEEALGRAENIHEFFGVVEEYDEQHEDPAMRTLESFLEWVALRTDLDRLDERQAAVTLMTLHMAKGLEFPVVFVVGLEEGIFPHANSMLDPQRLEEERRLMYVGVTRAQERLYLTHAHERLLYGQTQRNLPSRFIREIPERHMRTLGAAVGDIPRMPVAPERFVGLSASAGSEREPSGRVFGAGTTRTTAREERLELAPGDVVEHKTFGRGTVVEVGGDLVHVRFDGSGMKRLLIGYAPLRKVSA